MLHAHLTKVFQFPLQQQYSLQIYMHLLHPFISGSQDTVHQYSSSPPIFQTCSFLLMWYKQEVFQCSFHSGHQFFVYISLLLSLQFIFLHLYLPYSLPVFPWPPNPPPSDIRSPPCLLFLTYITVVCLSLLPGFFFFFLCLLASLSKICTAKVNFKTISLFSSHTIIWNGLN